MSDANLSAAAKALILKFFDTALTEDDVRRLNTLLAESAEARAYYLHAVDMHVDLTDYNESIQLAKSIFEEFPRPGVVEASTQASAVGHRFRSIGTACRRAVASSKLPYAALVLVSGMCLGCGIGIVAAAAILRQPDFPPVAWSRPVTDADVVARVAETYQCRWQASQTPETLPTRSLRPGQELRIDEGLLLVVFRSGASVLLNGPAVFQIRSDLGGKLYSGALSLRAPRSDSRFSVETQVGEFSTNGGLFGIAANEAGRTLCAAEAGAGSFSASPTDVDHSAVDSSAVDEPVADAPNVVSLSTGKVIRINAKGRQYEDDDTNVPRFVHEVPAADRQEFAGRQIHLSNLFDDSTTTSLTDAMATDAYQAAGETIDLGVAAVRDGGLDVDFSLVDGGPRVNLVNLGGGGPRVLGLPSNDTFRSVNSEPIRTAGLIERFSDVTAGKIEDGIGLSSNEMITFDLDELREAGQLGDVPMRFVVDRAGVNDLFQGESPRVGTVRLVAILSNHRQVLAAYVNGQAGEIVQRGDVHSFVFNKSHPRPALLRRDGRFASFDVAVGPEVQFLTLASVMHDQSHDDHAVFSGARLEIIR